ncbi:MAG: hypothetical protein A3I63_03675 [Betaproteobacteria bacterium RIFCSPLOWO2_02_FULL_66_14]|nr:MAG: hypothetical protein A3I63_03675 [Betaproteobacteria bacterium RIFCSPLOWO2_02_FULL_66_14]
MHALPELQDGFAAALADAARARDLSGLFRGPRGRTLARLAIYRGNVYGNCTKALESAFPIVRKIVGEGFFEALAHAFVKAQPSSSGDLNRYGERFAEFLAGFAPVADLPYLPDVARMEWFAHRAYFAEDSSAFDTVALRNVPAERYATLRPKLAAGCALLASDWPLERLWSVHQDGYAGGFEIDLDAGPDRVLIHRPRWRAEVISIPPGDHAFLDAAIAGRTLGESLHAAATADPDFDPSTALARWIHAHIITALV